MNLLAAPTPPPSDPTTTYVILAAACIGIVYVMTRMTKRQAKRAPEADFFTRTSPAAEQRAQRDMENVLLELSKMSRELSAQLDTRAAKLETLIGDADERIARLEVLLTQAPPRPSFSQPTFAPAAEPLMKLAQPSVPPIADDMAPSPSIEPSHAEVYRLADEGRSVPQIAGELNRPSGEVELILALRPRS